MNQSNSRGIWIGVIAIIVVILLGWWWISANQPASTTAGSDMASTTAATSTSTGSSLSVTTESGDTVKDIVASLASGSEYASLFNSTGVASLIGSGGQFTIFVPTNAAFSSLPSGTISSMTAAQLKRLVEYSIVSGRAIQPGEESTGVVQAYSGDPLNFSDLNNIPTVNSSIVVAEYKGSNGVVYTINQVLLPPQKSNE
jgi:uncharacterized surface protein with fasciclin (FAS1) repeats